MSLFRRLPFPPRAALRVALLCCLAFPGAAWADEAAGENSGTRSPSPESRIAGRRFSATRAFVGGVTRDDAAIVAETAARETAMRSVARSLVSLPSVRVAGMVAPSSLKPPNLLALAHATVETPVILISGSRRDSTVTVTVAVSEPGNGPPLEARIRKILIHPERLEVYEETILRETSLVAEFDALIPAPASGKNGRDAEARALEIVGEIKALRIYREQISQYDGTWKNPAELREAMLRALALAPGSALARSALGDASLQLGRSQEAFEAQTLALRADPRFARAYHSRGAAALALGHLSTAVADFSEAIRLAPRTAAYYRDRGMARHLLGETAAMCGDLHAACSLGDCDKYRWAMINGFCARPVDP